MDDCRKSAQPVALKGAVSVQGISNRASLLATSYHQRRLRTEVVCPGRGFALITGVVLLLIVSLLALAAVREVTLQERIAANWQDRYQAFQAAETALRAGEQWLVAQIDGNETLRQREPPPTCTIETWPDADGHISLAQYEGSASYRVGEMVGDNRPRTRDDPDIGSADRQCLHSHAVYARASGISSATAVWLRSTYTADIVVCPEER